MKLKYLFVTLLIFSSLQAKQTLTIDQIVELTLKHSPDIDSSRFDFKAAKQRVKSAEGLYLPTLDLSASAGKQGSKLKGQNFDSSDLLRGSIGASQLLYDFGKTTGRIDGSKKEALAYEAKMQQIISDKIFIVKKSYYNILKAKSFIDVQYKNVTLQRQQLNRAKKYLKSGIKTIIDVTDAQVELEQAILDLENAKYDLELQRATLEEAMGFEPNNGNYDVYKRKVTLSNLSKKLPKVSSSLNRLESFAYIHRYAMQSSKHMIESAKSNVNTQTGRYYPTISLGADYTTQKVNGIAAGMLPEDQGSIAVNVNWNLFEGQRTDAAVQEAKISVLRASSQLQSVKLAIKKQVVDSYIGLRRSKKNVLLSQSIAKASLEKYIQAKKRYENELADYIELQQARQGYIESLSNVVESYYNYYISLAQLDHSIGK
ncbi:type I secretion outer membrane protein [hydrothermal vent metagenome]|uniref:Type I secretion outer membrane protein n=1 Tax=hydrothermal vent metagenome TaxID=652676 RepID=A0A1W1EBV8_9ZZZZ